MLEAKIIVVDDNRAVLTTLKLILRNHFRNVIATSDPSLLPALLAVGDADAVLLDMNFGAGRLDGEDGLFWLRRIKEHDPCLPVVLITAFGDIDLAVRSLKEGAADFVTKPWDNERLVEVVTEAMRPKAQRQGDEAARNSLVDEMLRTQAVRYGKALPRISKEVRRRLSDLCREGRIGEVNETVERTLITCDKVVWGIDDLFPASAAEVATSLEDNERTTIAAALEVNRHNVVACARQLGVSRQTLYNKMKRYGLG